MPHSTHKIPPKLFFGGLHPFNITILHQKNGMSAYFMRKKPTECDKRWEIETTASSDGTCATVPGKKGPIYEVLHTGWLGEISF